MTISHKSNLNEQRVEHKLIFLCLKYEPEARKTIAVMSYFKKYRKVHFSSHKTPLLLLGTFLPHPHATSGYRRPQDGTLDRAPLLDGSFSSLLCVVHGLRRPGSMLSRGLLRQAQGRCQGVPGREAER